MRHLVLLCGLVCAAGAEDAIRPPQAGVLEGRRILGLPGNFVAGGLLREEVVSSASSGAWTVLKRRAAMEVLRGEEVVFAGDAPAGPARLGFGPDGAPAAAWLQTAAEVLRWDGSGFVLAFRLEDPVLAVGSTANGGIRIALRHADGVRLETRSPAGEVAAIESLPLETTAVLLPHFGGIVFTLAEEVVARSPQGDERRLRLDAVAEDLVEMGPLLVAARSAGRWIAISLAAHALRCFELPEAAP